MKRKPVRNQPRIITPEFCPFCRAKEEPDYKEFTKLTKFLSDRAKILGRVRSGVCARHQKRLSTAIKRARHLGLLPYTPALG
ncbi:30S ribosomal protein S18 [Candidatus Woesebacteria bacterium RIFCSPHIGHO2_01_FULL_38_9b]|uniref:Small ribosomal subunit protein bS18 n=1 Tax=Candidatus Woesebacteria bacterium RIFCSPHIGHO2_01_FULL_38_9b TaxID=1802493 RepID=A0A1F7Y4D3_9BACT|nr:MAG: 30S ribosomal protein S18 [Candidatus Woesebacteria bacterium RIFCSPHIGHO2_01_FULL_38_9b]